MALTVIDVASLLFEHLKFSVLINSISGAKGDLCLYARPTNSRLEDVVINTLPIVEGEVWDECYLNVNIYVPDMDIKGDSSQPDLNRLSILARFAKDSLEITHYAGDYTFSTKNQPGNLFKDIDKQHYMNFRVEFKAINI